MSESCQSVVELGFPCTIFEPPSYGPLIAHLLF